MLRPSYHMRKEPGRYILFRTDVPHVPIRYHLLHAPQAAVLGLSDGAHNLDELAAEVSATLRIPAQECRRRVRGVLHEYAHALVDGAACARRQPIPLLEFAVSEMDRDTVTPAYQGQLSAPLRLCMTIWPFCGNACPRCRASQYVNVHTSDPPMRVERFEDIFLEARALGCLAVLLSGGDPVLHPRILDIIRLAVACGLCCSISSRTGLSNAQRQELDVAGIRSAQIPDGHPNRLVQTLVKRQDDVQGSVAAFSPASVSAPAPRESVESDAPRCPAGRNEFFVAWQGKSYLCERSAHLPDMEIGDLQRESLLQLWQGPRLGRLLARGSRLFRAIPCAHCSHVAACALNGE